VYDQPDAASVHAQYDRLVDAVEEKLPQVAAHLDAAQGQESWPASSDGPEATRAVQVTISATRLRTLTTGGNRPGRRDADLGEGEPVVVRARSLARCSRAQTPELATT
jgi:hypothetical protein